jgi:hypothetical protein
MAFDLKQLYTVFLRLAAAILFLIVHCSSAMSQSAGTTTGTIKQIYSGNVGKSHIVIFRRTSKDAPYHVRVNEENKATRNFYVIKYASYVIQYLMIQKNGSQTLYYPLVWSDYEAVTINDLTYRSQQIVTGKVPRVSKENL